MTEIARFVRGPKLQESRADNAMAEPCLVAKNFGDLITAEHTMPSDNCESLNNHRYAVVVQDLATEWIQSYPCKRKVHKKPRETCKISWSPMESLKPITLTIPGNLAKLVGIFPVIIARLHNRSETNGIAERAVRKAKEGSSVLLLHSGLHESWWANSMECHTYLRNVTDLLSDGKTPYGRLFGQRFEKRLFHLVHWMSITL